MLNILKLWIKKYGGKYKVIKKRPGDKIDEILIGKNELSKTNVLKINKSKYFIINPEKNVKKPLKNEINSKNSKKMSEKEIFKILQFGFN